jgi:hypothetical protein
MLVAFIPGLVAGVATVGAGLGIERWCYFNNPWEAWGYEVQHVDRASGFGPDLIWSDGVVIAVSAVYFVGVVGLAIVTVRAIW